MAKRRVNHKALERLGPRGGRFVPERKEAPTPTVQRRPTGRPGGRGTARRARSGGRSSTGAPPALLIAAIPMILLVGIGIYALRDTTPPPAPAPAPAVMTVTPALTESAPEAQAAPADASAPSANPAVARPVADEEEEEGLSPEEWAQREREMREAEEAWLKSMQGGAAEESGSE